MYTDKIRSAVDVLFGGAWDAAWRMNRQLERAARQHQRGEDYHAAGLNGSRAVARRRRHIANGQITAANGLAVESA